ncbi:MAG: lipocalin family protein [Flavobacteriaceae bacterium]|nr:lipocalin family protein [Flavobacteriaceae bacterium]
MKILKLLFLSLFVSFAISCSSSDDDNGDNGSGETDAELVDMWIGSAVNYSGTSVTETQGITLTADFVGVGYDIDFTFDFTENPNILTAEGSYSIELTTTIQGQSTTQNIEDLGFENSGTWSRDGNQISLTYDGTTDVATITELTETTLILNIARVDVTDQGGVISTVTTDSYFTFTRQ